MKKIVSVLLMITIVLSITSCGNGEKKITAQNVIDKIIETPRNCGEINLILSDGNEQTCEVKINISKDGVQKTLMEVSARLKSETYTIEEYEKVTDIYLIDGKTLYLNITDIKRFLVKLDKQFAMFTAIFSFPGDYLIIDKDGIDNLCDKYGVNVPQNAEDFILKNSSGIDNTVNHQGEIIDELASKTGERTIVIDENSISFYLTQESVDSIFNVLLETDFEKFLSKDEKSAIEEGSYNSECYENIRKAREDLGDFSGKEISVIVGTDGKNVTVSMSGIIKANSAQDADSSFVTMNMTYKSGNETSQIDLPESTMSLEEFENVISKLFEAFMEKGAYR